jgi:predicted patatin/cPLA2 family phospholipase
MKLTENTDYEAYFSNPTRFVMVTTNCLTGKAEYLEDKSSADRVMSIVRASSSLPIRTQCRVEKV